MRNTDLCLTEGGFILLVIALIVNALSVIIMCAITRKQCKDGLPTCDSLKNTRLLLAETILYISHMIRQNFKDGGRAVLSHIQTQLCSLVLNVICNYNISR